MSRLPARDGIWHVETTTKTAEMCIRFEEALSDKDVPLAEDIPEWRRIHSAVRCWRASNGPFILGSARQEANKTQGFHGWDAQGSGRKARVHLRTRPNGMDGEWQDFDGEFDWLVLNKRFEVSFGLLMKAQLHKHAANGGTAPDLRELNWRASECAIETV